jgi:hypothetical protein
MRRRHRGERPKSERASTLPRSEACPRPLRRLSHWKGASFPFFFSGRGPERSNSFRPARPTRAHPGLDRQWPPERLPARVVVRLRLDEGDRERRQGVCQPHVACSIPQHFSAPQAVPPCRSWHRSSSERRRFLIPGSPRREHSFAGQQIGQLADPILAQRSAVITSDVINVLINESGHHEEAAGLP